MPLDKWRFDAILFDFDGTLANTRDDVWDALQVAATRVGGSLPNGVLANPVNLALPMAELFSKIVPSLPISLLPAFEAETTRYYREESVLPKTRFYPGMQGLLGHINAAQLPCYIVSVKEDGALRRVLALKDWNGYFNGHYSPDSLGGGTLTKTQLLQHLLQALHAEKPVYIGDSYTDILAARANNIASIGVTYGDGNTQELLCAKPDYVAHDVTELTAILCDTL